MDAIRIDHPTDRPNFSIVSVGPIHLAFSYETLIGVRSDGNEWKVSENYWGPTTGKHLNYLNSDKSVRLDAKHFGYLVDKVVALPPVSFAR